jgi:hypothetical protein
MMVLLGNVSCGSSNLMRLRLRVLAVAGIDFERDYSVREPQPNPPSQNLGY